MAKRKESVLKPCPFCGGSNLHDTDHDRSDAYGIVCVDCGASGPVMENDSHVVDTWNRRPATTLSEEAWERIWEKLADLVAQQNNYLEDQRAEYMASPLRIEQLKYVQRLVNAELRRAK